MQAFTKDFCLQNCIYPKLLKFHIFVCNAFALRPLLPCFFISFSVQFSRCRLWLKARIKYSNAWVFNSSLNGGDNRTRTDDPLLAKQVLSQLSYTPIDGMVGLSGLEPPTLRLSVVRSSQLSYRPILPIEGVPSKLNNVRQKRTDLRKSVGVVTNMSP